MVAEELNYVCGSITDGSEDSKLLSWVLVPTVTICFPHGFDIIHNFA